MITAPNHKVVLAPVRRQLAKGPCTQEQLWLDHAHRWQALGWSLTQMRLWVRCQPSVTVNDADPANPIYRQTGAMTGSTASLADEIVALLDNAARPMPLAQLMNKLPPGTLVTEPMLRAAVAADPRLQLTGPLVKLA